MRITKDQATRLIGVGIAVLVAVLAVFGVTVDIPIIDPVFPIR